jgi:hypothetical protein
VIAEHDLEPGNPGLTGGFDGAKNERTAEDRLQEFRFARQVPKSIAVAGREHECRIDGPHHGFTSRPLDRQAGYQRGWGVYQRLHADL